MFDRQNIHARYLKALNGIRNFLLAKKSREFLIFLFFVFVSFSFWLLQVLNDDYETELSIPLRMKNVPENVVLTSELPEELKIGVKDRGTVLVNYLLGHNGLKHIAEILGTQNYARLRFGIGNDFPRGHQIDYVLGNFTEEDLKTMDERLETAGNIIKSFCLAGINITMNQYNKK